MAPEKAKMKDWFRKKPTTTETKSREVGEQLFAADTQAVPIVPMLEAVYHREVVHVSPTYQPNRKHASTMESVGAWKQAKIVQYGPTSGGANVAAGGYQVFKGKVSFGPKAILQGRQSKTHPLERTPDQQHNAEASSTNQEEGSETLEVREEIKEVNAHYIQYGRIDGGANVAMAGHQLFEDEVEFGSGTTSK